MNFIDVLEKSYGYNAIQFVTGFGLMNGYADQSFHPQATVTWAELCQILTLFMENGNQPAASIKKSSHSSEGWEEHWAAAYIYYCIAVGILEEDLAETLDFDKAVRWKDAHELLSRICKMKKLLVIPESRRQGSTAEITRADVALLLYNACERTGHAIAKTVFRLNRRNRWSQSLRILFQYALCVQFVDSDIAMIFRLIAPEESRTWEEHVLCYEHMAKILKRKNLFRNKEPGPELFHYTALGALEKLTQKDVKFRLSNVAYLNDPMEGRLFIQIMQEQLTSDEFATWEFLHMERDEMSISTSFVASFTDEEQEQLPMWVQYSDGGGGCRIGIQTDSIKAPLYSIVYDANMVKRFLDSVRVVLISYLEKAGQVDMNTDIVFDYAAKVLTQVSYLYKDRHYEHEREMRILLFADPAKAKVESKIREDEVFPRLYIELDDLIQITSVTLGPKTTGIEKIAVGLASRNLDAKIIRKSEISYR